MRNISTTSFESQLLTTLASLDTNNKFDYITPIIENNSVIKNPLIATSFHNSEHFYNKFTVDQLKEFAEDTVHIATNIR